MNAADNDLPLPFSLAAGDLPEVTLSYGLYSSKTGAGVEELELSGQGRVQLKRTASYDSPPETRSGALPVPIFVRLLELIEDQRFEGLDDAYPALRPDLRRIVRLKLPQHMKQVTVDGEGNARFERVVSALLFAASLAEPAVLQRRFFSLMGPI
jgi:hypothetical protein